MKRVFEDSFLLPVQAINKFNRPVGGPDTYDLPDLPECGGNPPFHREGFRLVAPTNRGFGWIEVGNPMHAGSLECDVAGIEIGAPINIPKVSVGQSAAQPVIGHLGKRQSIHGEPASDVQAEADSVAVEGQESIVARDGDVGRQPRVGVVRNRARFEGWLLPGATADLFCEAVQLLMEPLPPG